MNHSHEQAGTGPPIYTVPLVLGDRELKLEFNYKAYMAMFEYTGIDLLAGWDSNMLGLKEKVCLLLSACITHHPEIQFDWYVEQLRGKNTMPIMKAVFAAFDLSMPERDVAANPPTPVM